jgi:hypothetical protein
LRFDGLEATYAGADDDANAPSIACRDVNGAVSGSHFCGSNGVVGESVTAPYQLSVQKGAWIKIAHFAGHFAGEAVNVDLCGYGQAAFPGEYGLPGIAKIQRQRRNCTNSSYDYAFEAGIGAFRHWDRSALASA